MAKAITRDLSQFDSWSDSMLVDDKIVAGIFGCSRNTVWRRAMKEGGVWPKAIKVSEQQTRFRVGDIRKTLAFLRGEVN